MNSLMEAALNEVIAPISDYLYPLFNSDDFDATISASQFRELMQLSGLDDESLRLALLPFAASYSYVPISNFHVGSIVRGLSGKLYFGANIELLGVQMGQTVHAEQCGISHAWMKGERGVLDISVTYSPCGHCRQFMNELTTANTLKIQLPNRPEQSLQDYLPDSFGPADLDIQSRLMDGVNHAHACETNDILVRKSVEALNLSHAPYSNNHSGVALQLDDGEIVLGAYAENAAFNPSLPPLQVALAQVLMAGKSFKQIQSAALVEMSLGTISHRHATESTLNTINPNISLSYISL